MNSPKITKHHRDRAKRSRQAGFVRGEAVTYVPDKNNGPGREAIPSSLSLQFPIAVWIVKGVKCQSKSYLRNIEILVRRDKLAITTFSL